MVDLPSANRDANTKDALALISVDMTSAPISFVTPFIVAIFLSIEIFAPNLFYSGMCENLSW